jgi:hypothetical protein
VLALLDIFWQSLAFLVSSPEFCPWLERGLLTGFASIWIDSPMTSLLDFRAVEDVIGLDVLMPGASLKCRAASALLVERVFAR